MFAGKDEQQAAAEPEKPAESEEQKPSSTEPEQTAAESEKQLEPAAAGWRCFYTCTCAILKP